jgi:hypothetical protein
MIGDSLVHPPLCIPPARRVSVSPGRRKSGTTEGYRLADLISSSKSYQDLLAPLKNQIRTAQVRAAVAVNRELVLLYWGIGKEILARQATEGWGTKLMVRQKNSWVDSGSGSLPRA